MTLPTGHVVLASGSSVWSPPRGVEYTIASVLHDTTRQLTRVILEGVDDIGDEVRTVLNFDVEQAFWVSTDQSRRHTVLVEFGDLDRGAA